ncbi:MAG: DUF4469 domain-containing protein [Dysgonamonadaceae bacterium]|jgi:hypothetical protein|nr:DUF4469 domain-containing protein [Dysgonamonadaceae bacterium]
MIDYVLEDLRLIKAKPGSRYARAVNVRSLTDDDLADAIARRNLGISKAEALAMLEAAAEIQEEWIASGIAVNTRLAHYHFSIPGSYTEGEFPEKALVRITPSRKLTDAAGRNLLRHVEPVIPSKIDRVDDFKSGTANRFITCGGNLKIIGHNLKITGTNPETGIVFINSEDADSIYPVPPVDIIVNKPTELLIVAPPMPGGASVLLKLATQYGGRGGKTLKTIRSITFNRILTVED